MVNVPYQVLETMKWWRDKQYQKPILPPNPQAVDASHLLKEMGQILQKTDLSEAEKAQKYGETLLSYKIHLKKQNKTKKKKKKPSTSTDSPKTINRDQTQTASVALHDQILQSVPKTMRRKAELLLGMIKNNNNLTWGEQGVVSYKGKRIHGSNIIDLINDAIRQRKVLKPEVGKRFQRHYMTAIYLKKLLVTQVDGNGCKNLTIRATVKNPIASFTRQKVFKKVLEKEWKK